MLTHVDLVRHFYGKDPLLAEDARAELVRNLGIQAIELLVPLAGNQFSPSIAVKVRLKSVAEDLGPAIVPHLVHVISSAPWSSKVFASPCFAGLPRSSAPQEGLIAILKSGRDFDAERIAIEALGFLGADGWAYELQTYSRGGAWGVRPYDDTVSMYPYEKLSSYVVEALARFIAKCTNRDRCDQLVCDLTDFVAQRQRLLPNRHPDGYALVARHGSEFTERSVDPILKLWGQHADLQMQQLCIDVLYAIAPLRAAKFLLGAATATSLPASVRRSASIALGELRQPQAAQRLATALRDPAVDRTHLDWAFSTLYAVSVDWSGTSDYIDVVLAQGDEPSRQLRYSLALRGDDRCLPELIDELDDSDPYKRWTAALTLVRILGRESRPYLDGRAEDAGDDLERCAMYAALVRAGDHDKVGSLHEALQATERISQLRSVWKLEILDPLRTASTFDARAFSLWSTEACVSMRQLQYFDALSPRSFDKPGPKFSSALSTSKPPLTKVFLSYSRRDAEWLKRFQLMLSPLIRNERVDLWDDTKIQPGKWRDQIQTAMSEANVALFLVSANFLASEFIMRHELPDLLRFAEDRSVTILWVLVDACLWEDSALAEYQGVNAGQPLSLMSAGEQTSIIKSACMKIRELLSD